MTAVIPSEHEPYEAFIEAALIKLRSHLAAREVPEEALTPDQVITAAEFAMHTTRLLLAGSAMGTVLLNTVTGDTATRATNKAGIPVWVVTYAKDGSTAEYQEAILNPEADWTCIRLPVVSE